MGSLPHKITCLLIPPLVGIPCYMLGLNPVPVKRWRIRHRSLLGFGRYRNVRLGGDADRDAPGFHPLR